MIQSEKNTKSIQGRVIRQDENSIWIQNEKEIKKLDYQNMSIDQTHSQRGKQPPAHSHLAPTPHPMSSSHYIGHLVKVTGETITLLTRNLTSGRSMQWMNRVLDPRRRQTMKIRLQVESRIRTFFSAQGFHETRTPLVVPSPGMEPHIRPFQVKSSLHPEMQAYLPTSPEFAMKRLLVGGLEKIFQICASFRDEPNSPIHQPEFTMLEWYRAFATYEDIMVDAENLIESLALEFFGRPVISYQGKDISVRAPWPRLSVNDLFKKHLKLDLTQNTRWEDLNRVCQEQGLSSSAHPLAAENSDLNETWDDLYFKLWLNCIEPFLPSDQAIFVTRYPASQAALAVVETDADGATWAKRFEIYAGGMELGNAFEELTDPVEQRKRFISDMNLREKTYGSSFPSCPLDEEFLHALTEGMPPAGGIAMGVDRLVMLIANEPDIQYTHW